MFGYFPNTIRNNRGAIFPCLAEVLLLVSRPTIRIVLEWCCFRPARRHSVNFVVCNVRWIEGIYCTHSSSKTRGNIMTYYEAKNNWLNSSTQTQTGPPTLRTDPSRPRHSSDIQRSNTSKPIVVTFFNIQIGATVSVDVITPHRQAV